MNATHATATTSGNFSRSRIARGAKPWPYGSTTLEHAENLRPAVLRVSVEFGHALSEGIRGARRAHCIGGHFQGIEVLRDITTQQPCHGG